MTQAIGFLVYLAVVALVFGGIVAVLATRRAPASFALLVCCVCASLPLGVGFVFALYLGRSMAAVICVAIFVAYTAHPLVLRRLPP